MSCESYMMGFVAFTQGGRSLATKVVHSGYYWPTLKADVFNFTRKCRRYQQFVDVPHMPPDNLHNLSSPWPFSMWGMDILEPLPKAPGQVKFLLVAVGYFTEWIKARPLREISVSEVEKFTWKHLICRYNLPVPLSPTMTLNSRPKPTKNSYQG